MLVPRCRPEKQAYAANAHLTPERSATHSLPVLLSSSEMSRESLPGVRADGHCSRPMHVEGFGQREARLHVGVLNLETSYLLYHLVFWHKYSNQWQRSCD